MISSERGGRWLCPSTPTAKARHSTLPWSGSHSTTVSASTLFMALCDPSSWGCYYYDNYFVKKARSDN
jgi:hypothetical protein